MLAKVPPPSCGLLGTAWGRGALGLSNDTMNSGVAEALGAP